MRNRLGMGAAALALAIFLSFAGTAGAQGSKMAVDAGTLKRMGVFLSNFTEVGFWDIASVGSVAREDLVRFGIQHNYINNFKSRIAKSNGTHGDPPFDLAIAGKWVAESVKKYFDLELEHGSVLESDPPYYYDGERYHLYGADGEAIYHARVKEAFNLSAGSIRMTGELYNADGNDDTTYPFEAVAKPHKFGGRDTWAIISLRTKTD